MELRAYGGEIVAEATATAQLRRRIAAPSVMQVDGFKAQLQARTRVKNAMLTRNAKNLSGIESQYPPYLPCQRESPTQSHRCSAIYTQVHRICGPDAVP